MPNAKLTAFKKFLVRAELGKGQVHRLTGLLPGRLPGATERRQVTHPDRFWAGRL